jgi:hypothetical protein
MKLLLKLAIAALLANAVFRVGSEYLNYVKFREDVREAVIFKSKTDDELQRHIMEAAVRYDVPLDDDTVVIQRQEGQIRVNGHYMKDIEVVPTFKYAQTFTFAVDAKQSTTALLIPAPPPPKPRQ